MKPLIGLAMLVFGVLTVWRPLPGCLDFWAHAAIGRWMVENGKLADHTLFLWTADQPHVYHHWLSEVIFYGLALLGPSGTMAATAILALVPFGLVWRRGFLWMAIPLVFAIEAIAVRLETRPELFTAIGVTIVLTTRLRWWLIPLFALWANLHGGVIIGVLLLAASLRWRAAVVALAASCLNPWGVFYFESLLQTGSYTFKHILEWRPLWESPAVPTEMLQVCIGLFVLAVFCCRQKEHVLWLCLMVGLAMLARRNLWPLAICCLVIAGQFQFTFGLMRFPACAVILAWIVLTIMPMPAKIATTPATLENGIVTWMRENPQSGRIFNDYENSAYLHWARVGPLYIDLMNAYPDQLMRDYHAIVAVSPRGKRLLDDVDIVILTTNRGSAESLAPLADYLDKTWHRRYAGNDGVIWMRTKGDEPVMATEFSTLESFGNDQGLVLKGIE